MSNIIIISDDYYGRSGPLGLTVTRDSHPIKEELHRTFEDELGLKKSDPNDGNHWGYYDTVVSIVCRFQRQQIVVYNNNEFNFLQSSTKHGRRISSFNAFLEPHLHRTNLHILLHAEVTKVTSVWI